MPFFLLAGLLAISCQVAADSGTVVSTVDGSDFVTAQDALVEAIEAEGLVVGSVLPFGRMLERTGAGAVQRYRNAQIVQFCSAELARRMVAEGAAQIVFCPLAIALYVTDEKPDQVVLAYRSPGDGSPARRQAGALLARLVERAASLAKLRW